MGHIYYFPLLVLRIYLGQLGRDNWLYAFWRVQFWSLSLWQICWSVYFKLKLIWPATAAAGILNWGGNFCAPAFWDQKKGPQRAKIKNNAAIRQSHHLRSYPSMVAWRVSPVGGGEGEKGLKPPWSLFEALLKSPLKPFSSPLEAPLKPPWSLKPPSSPLEAPFTLKAPFKPFSSPLHQQAPFEAFTFKPPSSFSSPLETLEALFKPPSSLLRSLPCQAPLKPFSSPFEGPLKPFSSPPLSPLAWSPSSEAPLKRPWSPSEAPPSSKPPSSPPEALLKPLKPFSSPLEAPLKPYQAPQASFKPSWSPRQAPWKPKPFPKGSFMQELLCNNFGALTPV